MNDNSFDSEDLLDDLLANDTVECESSVTNKALNVSSFNFIDHTSHVVNETKSVDKTFSNKVCESNTDPSNDENKYYFKGQNYPVSEYNIKILLKNKGFDKSEHNIDNFYVKNQLSHFNKTEITNNEVVSTTMSENVYGDSIFDLQIVRPLISLVELKRRMTGCTLITVSNVKNYITSDIHNDWVIGGVLISKLQTQTSQKGNQYCVWKISDLSNDMKTVSVFLFGSAYKQFWKTTTGTVISILNPAVLNNRSNIDQAVLSVDNSQKVIILGNSKDMGTCRSVKKNGEPCSTVINISQCKFCIYHVKQEYNTLSRRAELQSISNKQKFSSLNISKNKILGKKIAVCSSGFTCTPVRKNIKMFEEDNTSLALFNKTSVETVKLKPKLNVKKASIVELTKNQMKKDHEKLNELKESRSDKQFIINTLSHVIAFPSKVDLPSHTDKRIAMKSSLSHSDIDSSKIEVDFSEPFTKKQIAMAKLNAVKWVLQNGAIKRKDPNKTRLNKVERIIKGVKRQREAKEMEQDSKRFNSLQNKFKELLETGSVHTDLLKQSQQEEKEKYFNKLEMKDSMEKKMMSIYQIDCKVVKCMICKYTALSSSDLCKEQKHPIRVLKGVKRFFKCHNCGNRTNSIDRMPFHNCKRCGSLNWVKCSMIDEKKIGITKVNLSIRGEEEKFLGSTIKNANLDLLVT